LPHRGVARFGLRSDAVLFWSAVLVLGVWFAQRASAAMVGEGLYWKTMHWLRSGEHATNRKFDAALAVAKTGGKPLVVANGLEHDVLPFWREASDRLSAIDLKADSPHLATLELLQDIADGRVHGYERLDQGLRKNDPEEIRKAEEELKQVEQNAKERQQTPQ
jgi:hypothetical protein